MPTTMTADEPSRWPKVLMPTLVTDKARRPERVAASHAANSAASSKAPCHGSATHAASTTINRRMRSKVMEIFMGPPSTARERVDDVQTHGAPGGQRSHQHA